MTLPEDPRDRLDDSDDDELRRFGLLDSENHDGGSDDDADTPAADHPDDPGGDHR